jgi:hypothetical protein
MRIRGMDRRNVRKWRPLIVLGGLYTGRLLKGIPYIGGFQGFAVMKRHPVSQMHGVDESISRHVPPGSEPRRWLQTGIERRESLVEQCQHLALMPMARLVRGKGGGESAKCHV